jgi:threonine synthase
LSEKYFLRCVKCSSELGANSKASVCQKCGGALETIYDYDNVREVFSEKNLETRPPSVWKYFEILPVEDPNRVVTLGEGGTRLVEAKALGQELELQNLFLKDESRNPTCSFKDRKSTVAVTKAKEFGFETVVCATAGNAGSSVAAYAAKAGLRAIIFTFRNITQSKLAKLQAYGADVLIVDGSTWEVLELTTQACAKYGWYSIVAASRYNPYVKDGAKTEAIEVCEQLRWKAPDWLIVPLGGGCGISSCWKGVRELRRLGLIDRLPKMVGVQGAECAPVVNAFNENTPPDKIERVVNGHTIAHSIEDDFAPDGDQALMAIRESGGKAVGVPDDQILREQRLIGKREGLFIEPASSAPVAAARMLVDEGTIDRKDTVVCIATGFGLNEPEALLNSIQAPPTVRPRIQDLDAALKRM